MAKREKLVDYTTPILIDSNAVVHFKDDNVWQEFLLILRNVIKYVFILLIVGIIVGLILFFVDPNRNVHSKRLTNKFLFFMRSLMTGISSMFGEMGYLSERSSLKIHGVIISVIIFMIGFTLIMYVQAKVTQLLLTAELGILDENTIKGKRILGYKGYAPVESIRRFGAKIIDVEDLTAKELVDKYMNNTDKYDGLVLTYLDVYPIRKKISSLTASIGFGNEAVSMIVSKNRPDLLTDINMQLLDMRKSLELQRICETYFGDATDVPACSLV